MSREATAHADELVGSLVDNRYKVLEPMAAGSMGAVYRAEREPVGKIVAIKFLHASYATDAEFLGRFERETRVMSKLAHPNCVSVVDFGVWEGSPYLVMEYVAGKTLRTIMDQGPVEPARALVIARQIAAGLAHAHAQGITHRDVKPANIMISEEIGAGEHVRILDFGLARLRGAVGRDATQSNVVVGTPNYMAPEQTVGGGTIDARTDIYAVGVVLFEMLAGERPFQAEDTMALLGMHRAAPIPKLVDRVTDDVELPDGIQDVIEKAMAKAPSERYQSAIELADAIDDLSSARAATLVDSKLQISSRYKTDSLAVAPTVVDVSSPKIERDKPARSSTRAGAVLALIVLGSGAAAAWYVTQGDDDPPRSRGDHIGSGSPAAIDPVTADAAPEPIGSAGSAMIFNADRVGSAGDTIPAMGSETDPLAGSGSDAAGSGGDLSSAGEGSADPAAMTEAEGSASEAAGSAAPGAASDVPDEIDMAPDPVNATNPSPIPSTEAEDEAADAPATNAEIEKRAPRAPVLAKSVEGAVAQIRAGKRDAALASLRALWKKSPKSAYIPFLLGNLYFDQTWWSVAMDHYRAAINKHSGYKKNATLIRNVIRMLASKKTSGKAEYFLRRTIGRSALPYLQHAARNDKNATVKRYATYLARLMR